MNSSTTQSTPAHAQGGGEVPPESRGHFGWIVAGSLATGLVAALLLAATPLIPAEESALTGAVLCGFALGWAMLAVLSVRFSDQPQQWAFGPAVFLAVAGVVSFSGLSAGRAVFAWVWPPLLFALVVWTFLRVRQIRCRGGRWLLYPVLAVMLLASVGGGYETVRE